MIHNCKLFISSNCAHLQQIYAGFNTLFKNKFVNLEIDTSGYSVKNNSAVLKMLFNGKYIVYYDTHDGYNFSDESFEKSMNVFELYLDDADYFFKRSCSVETNKSINNRNKIFPLGLNYGFEMNSEDRLIQNRLRKSFLEKLMQVMRDIKHSKFLNKVFHRDDSYINQQCIEYIPFLNNTPKVLFISRLWDPRSIDSILLKDEWRRLNNFRIECVKSLKKELKEYFIGGIIEDQFSKQQCKEFIIPPNYSKRNNFIKLMHQSDICVATTGLHKSIGWKFAEYVASSKAIVSEPLLYELPGNFSDGENYCEYRNLDECVSEVSRLIINHQLRFKMMINNYYYYNNYVRPDNLILNSINKIIKNEMLKVQCNI